MSLGFMPTFEYIGSNELHGSLGHCNHGYPCEDVFKKFDFETLTPPLSPEQPSTYFPQQETADACPHDLMTSSTSRMDDLVPEFMFNPTSDLPELKDTCNEIFKQESRPIDCRNKVLKDCMWNGRNEQRLLYEHRRSRSNSPCSLSCSPVNGCIDPGAVFNSYFGDHFSGGRRLKPSYGTETPSDSEEEVDVVTVVEKKPRSSFAQLQPAVNTVGNRKILTTIVQQDGVQSPVAVFATQQKTTLNTNNNAKTPRISMLITSEDHIKGKKTLHLKCVPIINASPTTSPTATKRKSSLTDSSSNAVLQLMRVAPSSATEKEQSGGAAEKKRKLSLEGVSMISDTGIKRNTFLPSRSGSRMQDPVSRKLSVSDKVVKVERNSSALLAEMKKPKKSVRKIERLMYESPTSSPNSSDGDSPTSPKQRGSRGRSMTSSSGSDEDSIRAAHNVLERQRREGLRHLYHVLRREIPELAENDRAAKVVILKKAKDHVMELEETHAMLRMEKEEEEQKRLSLKRRLHELVAELTSVAPYISNHCERETKSTYIDKFAIVSH